MTQISKRFEAQPRIPHNRVCFFQEGVKVLGRERMLYSWGSFMAFQQLIEQRCEVCHGHTIGDSWSWFAACEVKLYGTL